MSLTCKLKDPHIAYLRFTYDMDLGELDDFMSAHSAYIVPVHDTLFVIFENEQPMELEDDDVFLWFAGDLYLMGADEFEEFFE